MMEELPVDAAARDLAGAVDYLLDHEAVTSSQVGAVGFCMGGGFVLVLAALEGERAGAAVPYYGAGAYDQVDLGTVTAPVLGHFGTEDEWAPPEQASELERILREEAGVEADIRTYDGAAHAFFNDEDHMGTYDPDLAARTWEATVTFLREHLAD